MTPEESSALGKAARKRVPRSSHAEWTAAADRRPALSIITAQNATRVPELVPIRHGRMLASPFSFFRGAAAVMASDLSTTPDAGLDVQLCGDAHLSNFGLFAAPDRRIVFDLNDFDETLPGPFEWDLKRLAASFAVAGRERGFSAAERRTATLAALEQYREVMREFAAMGDLAVWYARLDVADEFERLHSQVTAKQQRAFERELRKARGKDSKRALARLTHVVDGEPRIVSDPPLITPVAELDEVGDAIQGLERLLAEYAATLAPDRRELISRYRIVDAARKVVGVGSVGTQAWIVLMLGRDGDDPLFLQSKQAERSVLEPYLRKSRYGHQGRRVVEGQRLLQAASDILLGWLTGPEGRDFYLRQLWDGKRSAEVELMEPAQLATYARMCGWTLARAHARSGDRIAIGSYLGRGATFSEALADFAETYADQNERDYAAFKAAGADERIAVSYGV